MRHRPRLLAVLVAIAAVACKDSPPPAPQPSALVPLVPLVAVSGACVTRDAPEVGEPEEPEPDGLRARAMPDDPKDLCAVADSNLARAESTILAAPRAVRALAAGALAALQPWDRHREPARLRDVTQRFALSRADLTLLEKNGFVVPARLAFPSYANAFHEIYQSEMPLFVSVDAILHAVFRGNDQILLLIEARRLEPLLRRTLAVMHCALPGAAVGYPEETARDLDLYLTVARSLLADHPVVPAYPETSGPAGLVAQAKAAAGVADVDVFGRLRRVDFGAFAPRGHYVTEERLTPYFRASMWLSRLEWNLVSRSSRSSAATPTADPRETPREAVDALALADLVGRAGVADAVRALSLAWSTFGGQREDVSLSDLSELRARAGIGALTEPRVFERLAEAIGDRYQRTARLHFMPEGTTALPAIATFLGARVVADTTATRPLVAPATPGRHIIGAADMAYALGHDNARAYLGAEEARFPGLAIHLGEARALAHAQPPTPSHAADDLYGLWFQAILGLAERPAGALPSFMRTEAFADLRLDSAITAFGQIRHSAVLFAGQGYDQGGCEIPDAYVEPAQATYQALAAYADRGAAALAVIDPGDTARARAYFVGLGRTLRVLDAIAAGELAGRALADEERRFLSMILELTAGGTGGAPTYSGWYFDLFPARTEALARADFIADYFTSGEEGTVAYAGARPPSLGIFVVDTGGAPRVVVGPVAHAYEHHGPFDKRLDDEAASHLTSVVDPWVRSYTVPAQPVPAVTVDYDGDAATVTATEALGAVTIELLDHHRRLIEALTNRVAAGQTRFAFKPVTEERPVEVLHLHVGAADIWSDTGGGGTWIDTNPPSSAGGAK